MDKLFIGDISTDYKYAQYGSYYIDLYNTNRLRANQTYNYKRVYLYDNYFVYDDLSRTIGQYSQDTILPEIPVSQELYYRRDFPHIITMWFIYMIVALWFFNLMTSAFKKGGLLHGLL